MQEPYNKREVDTLLQNIYEKLERIEEQTTKHNGRMTKIERYLLVIGCVAGTLLIVSGSEFIQLLKVFI